MGKNELKHLNRKQLLMLLLEAEEENVRLREELAEAHAQLEDRRIRTEKCGDLATAALELNGVFAAAEAACREYTENMRLRAEELLRAAEEKSGQSEDSIENEQASANE